MQQLYCQDWLALKLNRGRIDSLLFLLMASIKPNNPHALTQGMST